MPSKSLSLNLALAVGLGFSTFAHAQTGVQDQAVYGERNATNLKSSQDAKIPADLPITDVSFDYNHIIFDGQSLSVGADSTTALSTPQTKGNLMIGESVAYNVKNAKVFNPMVYRLENDTRSPNGEEPPVLGAVNFFKYLYDTKFPNGPQRLFIGSSCGVSGKSIEQLSKGGLRNYWANLVGSVQSAKDLTAAQNKTYGIIGLCWVQGESNYNPNGDWVGDKDGYKAKLKEFRQTFVDDCAIGIAKQAKPPGFFTYQTSGAYSNDTNGLAIGMAQWEFAKETPGAFLTTPTYPFVDFGGHLTSNGYRWMGAQFAKVMEKVIIKREKWVPLSPRGATRNGRTITIDFHVPEPPLAFDGPYVGRKKADIPADKGFVILDADGQVPIESVRIVLDTIVEIVCKRDFFGENVIVRYAAKTGYDGNGFLRDSDPAVAEDVYIFDPARGQKPDENLPDLIGKPYPLFNWSIAFSLKAVPL